MERTKQALINAFGQLLDEKPMTKITVKDIVERCQINRNTFYYHFQDIPTLFQQAVEEKTDELIQRYYTPDHPMECVRPLIDYLVAHKRAVLHVYQYVHLEILLPHINRAVSHMIEKYLNNVIDDLPDESISTDREDAQIIMHFYQCAIIGLALDWLDHGMKYDAAALSERIIELLDGTSKRVLLGTSQTKPS